jgi:hypothetical protein
VTRSRLDDDFHSIYALYHEPRHLQLDTSRFGLRRTRPSIETSLALIDS